jgi:hypothetical protein
MLALGPIAIVHQIRHAAMAAQWNGGPPPRVSSRATLP